MPKRSRSETEREEECDDTVIDMSALPEPVPEGRIKDPSLLKQMQIRSVLQDISNNNESAMLTRFILDPLLFSLKWKKADVKLLANAIRNCSQTLKTLDLNPSACNMCLPSSIASLIVEHCKLLECLRLRDTPIDAETIGRFGELEHLSELCIGGIAVSCGESPLDTGRLGVALSKCTQLQKVLVTDTDISNEVLQQIAGGCKCLVEVDLSSSDNLGDTGVSALAQASGSSLTTLSLLNCDQVGPVGVQALAACTNLETVNLQRVRCTTALPALCEGCPNIVTLKLSCCALMDTDLAAIAKLSKLKVLDLNGASGFSAQALQDGLPKLRSLENLSLNGVRLKSKQLDRVVQALATSSAKLNYLDLNNSSISAAGVEAMESAQPDCEVTTIHCNL